jgi:succinoglycan biosynthesis transport protein ExoP
MSEHDDREEGGRGKSLLSLSSAIEAERQKFSARGTASDPASVHADAVARHQQARARREARSNDVPPTMSEEQSGRTGHVSTSILSSTAKPGLIERLWHKASTAEPAQPRDPSAPIAMQPSGQDDTPALRDEEESWTPAPPPVTGMVRGGGRDGGDDDQWKPLIDPGRVVGGIVDSKVLIVLSTLLGAGLGVLAALSTPKKFEAVAEILIDPRDLKIVDRTLTDINGLPSDSTIAIVENQVRVLTSSTVLNKVVEKLNLESDPEFNGRAGGVSLNPLDFVRSLLSRSDGAAEPGMLRATAATNLAENLSVERTGKTFVVLIHATSLESEKAALIANTMTDVFLQTSGAMQADTASRANDELNRQLAQMRKEVEEAERKVETYRAENDLINAQGRLITDDEILKLNDQLSVARARTLELNARADSARSLSADAVLNGSLPEAAASGVITELRAQYAAAKQEVDRLSVRLGPRHPSLQSAQAQVAAARDQIGLEVRRIAAQVQTELKRSVQLEQELAARLAQLKVRQGDVSNEMVALRELEREAAAKRAVYESFLLRARETGEQKEINTTNVSVISEAYPPLKAFGPSRAMIAATGTLLGLLAGIGIGGLRGVIRALRDSGEVGRRRRAITRPTDRGEPTSADRRDQISAHPVGLPRPPAASAASSYSQAQSADIPLFAATLHSVHPYAGQEPAQSPPASYHPHPSVNWVQQPMQPQISEDFGSRPPYIQPLPQQPAGYASYAPVGHPHPGLNYLHPDPDYPQQPVPSQPGHNARTDDSTREALAQISESVREFRDAVRELTESRQRHRYF